jgi:aspartate/glutamate racemase
MKNWSAANSSKVRANPIARSSRGWWPGGADCVILGCTELPLLVMAEDSAVPLFDTTTLHAMAAVDMALS